MPTPNREAGPCLLFLLPLLFACQGEADGHGLVEQWQGGVDKLAEPRPIQEVVLYFDNHWHAVAYEVLAERSLTMEEEPPEGQGETLEEWTAWFESVELEARETFYDRFGLYPPDYFPPRNPHNVTQWKQDLAGLQWAIQAVEWEKILRRNGLEEEADMEGFVGQWKTAKPQAPR